MQQFSPSLSLSLSLSFPSLPAKMLAGTNEGGRGGPARRERLRELRLARETARWCCGQNKRGSPLLFRPAATLRGEGIPVGEERPVSPPFLRSALETCVRVNRQRDRRVRVSDVANRLRSCDAGENRSFSLSLSLSLIPPLRESAVNLGVSDIFVFSRARELTVSSGRGNLRERNQLAVDDEGRKVAPVCARREMNGDR